MKNLISKAKIGFTTAKNKAMLAACGIKEKRESGDHLVEVLGVIIVAVVLLFLFKGKIIDIFTTFMNKTNTELDTLFTKNP